MPHCYESDALHGHLFRIISEVLNGPTEQLHNTRANLDHQAEVEVSFVDLLSRRGVRFRGQARVVEPGAEFDALAPTFESIWGPELKALFNAIVVIPVDIVKPFQTPAYETGATEAELRALWKSKVADLPG